METEKTAVTAETAATEPIMEFDAKDIEAKIKKLLASIRHEVRLEMNASLAETTGERLISQSDAARRLNISFDKFQRIRKKLVAQGLECVLVSRKVKIVAGSVTKLIRKAVVKGTTIGE